MKAAVLHALGGPPRYEEFQAPSVEPGETLLKVTASALTQVARSMAAGLHSTAPRILPAVAGPSRRRAMTPGEPRTDGLAPGRRPPQSCSSHL